MLWRIQKSIAPNRIQTLDHPAHSIFTIPPMLTGSCSHLITIEKVEKHYFMTTCITVLLDHFTGWKAAHYLLLLQFAVNWGPYVLVHYTALHVEQYNLILCS